jgi:hypothetical protein
MANCVSLWRKIPWKYPLTKHVSYIKRLDLGCITNKPALNLYVMQLWAAKHEIILQVPYKQINLYGAISILFLNKINTISIVRIFKKNSSDIFCLR